MGVEFSLVLSVEQSMKASSSLLLLAVAVSGTPDQSHHALISHGHPGHPGVSIAVHSPHHAVHAPAPAPYGPPAPAYHAPAPVYHEPAPVYHKPAPTYHVPEPVYAPKPVYHKPEPVYKPKPVYHKPEPANHPAPKPYHEKEYPPEPYSYEYAVADDYSKANFRAGETSDGNVVSGSYSVQLPDGRIQHVKNTADHYNGYQAEVTYEGTAHYPEEKPYHPPAPAYHKPEPVYHKPAPAYHKPEPVYHKPAPAYHTPAPVY